MEYNTIIQGDALEVLKTFPNESIDCVVTSPPYWALRDYGVEGQLGLEPTFQEYVNKLCDIFDEIKRVLKKEGTVWVNIGDSYAGSGKGPEGNLSEGTTHRHLEHKTKPFISNEAQAKSLIQIPSRFAIEMTNRGWILRNEIIWHKPSCMPASVKDRFTVDYEKIFFFAKNKQYFFESQYEPFAESTLTGNPTRDRKTGSRFVDAVPGRSPQSGGQNIMPNPLGRNKRTVWSISTKPFADAHFAVFPPELIITPIKAGCPEGGIVLDPFMGSGTTAYVARQMMRKYIGIELNPKYIKIANSRLAQNVLLAA